MTRAHDRLFYPAEVDYDASVIRVLAGYKTIKRGSGEKHYFPPVVEGIGLYSVTADGEVELPVSYQSVEFWAAIAPVATRRNAGPYEKVRQVLLPARAIEAGMHIAPVSERERDELYKCAQLVLTEGGDEDQKFQFWPEVRTPPPYARIISVPAAFWCDDVLFYDGVCVSVRRWRIMTAEEAVRVFAPRGPEEATETLDLRPY